MAGGKWGHQLGQVQDEGGTLKASRQLMKVLVPVHASFLRLSSFLRRKPFKSTFLHIQNSFLMPGLWGN